MFFYVSMMTVMVMSTAVMVTVSEYYAYGDSEGYSDILVSE